MGTYSGAGCSGDPSYTTDVSILSYDAVCSGETCDYAVVRSYLDTTGSCGGDYGEVATFVGQCYEAEGTAYESTCSSSGITVNFYATTDCTGDVVTSSDGSEGPETQCSEVISCSADGTDPDTDTDTDTNPDTDDDVPTVCAGYYVLGAALSPLDVCVNNATASGDVASMKYSCNNNVGAIMTYSGADCSGTGESRAPDGVLETIVCAGSDCSYAVSKEYEDGAAEGECGEAYEENAIFTDRCVAIVGFGTLEIYYATCSGTSGSLMTYSSADCSGTPTETQDIGEDACSSV